MLIEDYITDEQLATILKGTPYLNLKSFEYALGEFGPESASELAKIVE